MLKDSQVTDKLENFNAVIGMFIYATEYNKKLTREKNVSKAKT